MGKGKGLAARSGNITQLPMPKRGDRSTCQFERDSSTHWVYLLFCMHSRCGYDGLDRFSKWQYSSQYLRIQSIDATIVALSVIIVFLALLMLFFHPGKSLSDSISLSNPKTLSSLIAIIGALGALCNLILHTKYKEFASSFDTENKLHQSLGKTKILVPLYLLGFY